MNSIRYQYGNDLDLDQVIELYKSAEGLCLASLLIPTAESGFKQVDGFTQTLLGNRVPVVIEAERLATEEIRIVSTFEFELK